MAIKDQLIKRKNPAVMMGQAISVVGGYTEKTPATEAPPTTVKRLPEPILPTTQTKWAPTQKHGRSFVSCFVRPTCHLHDVVLSQIGRSEREEKSVSPVRCGPAFIRLPDWKVNVQSSEAHPALREGDRSEWHVSRKWSLSGSFLIFFIKTEQV